MDKVVCNCCPLRLFNSKHYNLKGYGNAWSDKLVIIPNVDYGAYKKGSLSYSEQLNILMSITSTGELAAKCYVLPLIRCNEDIGCKVNDEIVSNCLRYLSKDIKTYDWHNILVCGNAWERMFHRSVVADFDKAVYSPRNRRVYIGNYNPLIKYIDDNKFEVFKNRFIEWLNYPNDYSYEKYDLLYL